MQETPPSGQWHPVVIEARRRAAGRDNYFVSSSTPVLTPAQIAGLRELVDARHEAAGVEGYGFDASNAHAPAQRRTKVRWLTIEEHRWVYDVIWEQANQANRLFGFELVPFHDTIQLARYDAEDQGFFRWHADTIPADMSRKISIVVPLCDSTEYEGGALEFNENGAIRCPPQRAGAPIMFPSWLLHRVTPVTRGRRYSLVAWIRGPAWR
jgi:PKHD-type hydroxylase